MALKTKFPVSRKLTRVAHRRVCTTGSASSLLSIPYVRACKCHGLCVRVNV